MKKVVVVVKGEKEFFIGEKLEIINKGNLGAKSLTEMAGEIPNTLIIKSFGEVIAVFNQWQYWRKISD